VDRQEVRAYIDIENELPLWTRSFDGVLLPESRAVAVVSANLEAPPGCGLQKVSRSELAI
jgi:hypothetical protein